MGGRGTCLLPILRDRPAIRTRSWSLVAAPDRSRRSQGVYPHRGGCVDQTLSRGTKDHLDLIEEKTHETNHPGNHITGVVGQFRRCPESNAEVPRSTTQ